MLYNVGNISKTTIKCGQNKDNKGIILIFHEMKIIIFGARDGARIVKAKLEKQ